MQVANQNNWSKGTKLRNYIYALLQAEIFLLQICSWIRLALQLNFDFLPPLLESIINRQLPEAAELSAGAEVLTRGTIPE